MTKSFEGAICCALVLVGWSAFAQRLSFPDFVGPGAAPLRTQLVTQVCDSADCVPASKVTTGGRPDLKKAKKENVQFFVTGTVTKKGKVSSLDLTVTPVTKGKPTHKSLAIEPSGLLSPKNLQQAVDLLNGALGTPAPSSTPDPKPTPPVPPPTTSPTPKPRADATPAAEPTPATPAEPEPAPTPKASSKPHFLVVDVGADLTGRALTFVQTSTPNLRNYGLPIFPLPALHLEFYPLALVREDLISGLGLEAGFAFNPALKSRLASDTVTFATSAMRVDVGLKFRILPISSFAIAFVPYAGLRLQSFSVGAASTNELLGLPNVSYTGLRAGLGLEVPLVDDLLTAFGRFGVIPVFSSGQLISATYFPSGSTFGLEADVGLGVQIVRVLQVRASFEYTQFAATFKTTATDTYVAAGAIDRWLGGNVSVRLQF